MPATQPASFLQDGVGACFMPAADEKGPRIGVELELIPRTLTDPPRPVSLTGHLLPFLERYAAQTGALHLEERPDGKSGFRTLSGGRFSFEPGGQIEYSSPPMPGPAPVMRDVRDVLDPLREAALLDGIELASLALDPWHTPEEVGLQMPTPRYRAMQTSLAGIGPWGLRMMRLTSALQVNLDIGPPAGAEHRWQTLQSLAPVLTAIFADSPVREGRPTGDKSHRSVIWQHTDPSRTGIVRGGRKEDYLRFALDAQVLVVREGPDDWRAPVPGLRFRDWLESGWEGRFPEEADWRYHLTTLFPEIRPRGTFEVRCIDGQAHAWWDVPVLLLAGLCDGGRVESRLRALMEEYASQWEDPGEVLAQAARMGPAAPLLGDLPIQVMHLGREGVGRLGEASVTEAQRDQFESFLERYTARGRCPADES